MNCCICNGQCCHTGPHTYCMQHQVSTQMTPVWSWPGSPAISDASLATALAPLLEAIAQLTATVERLVELQRIASGEPR